MKSISPIIATILSIVIIVAVIMFQYYPTGETGVYTITIYNTQNISTSSPFQQDIAICNGTTVQNPYFEILGYNSALGPNNASVTLPSNASIYLCNGAAVSFSFSPVSWTVQEEDEYGLSSLGYQYSNTCSYGSMSSLSDVVVGGVAINTNEYEYFQGTSFNDVSTFSYTYNVTSTSNVIISIACSYSACTSINVSSGCQVLFNTTGDGYETSFMAVCYNQTPGSYTISGSLNSDGYVSVGVYEFNPYPPSLPNNFAYVNNPTLFNEIDSNGQNVMFFTNPSNPTGSLLYSWYEGQENFNGMYCDIWWVNISNGIPANSNITIYMKIGSNSTNYYSQYYPYVGANPLINNGTYGSWDNGQDVFYAYFNANTPLSNFNINPNISFSTATYDGINAIQLIGTTHSRNGILVYEKPLPNQAYFGLAYFAAPSILDSNGEPSIGLGNSAVATNITYYNGDNPSSTTYFGVQGVYNGSWNESTVGVGTTQWQIDNFTYVPNWSYVIGCEESPQVYCTEYNNYLSNQSVLYLSLFFADADGLQLDALYNWALISAYPPNGVMPSIYIS